MASRSTPISRKTSNQLKTLFEKIATEVFEFRSKSASGAPATKLLLGQREWEELEELARNNAPRFIMHNVAGTHRPVYCGMKVYLMDDTTYVGVMA